MRSVANLRLMPVLAPVAGVLLLLTAVRSQQPPSGTIIPSVAAKPGSAATSTGVNGQFVIHGADLTTRSAFILLCDDTATALGKLLRDDGKFMIPVVVVLKTPPDIVLGGPAINTNINQLAHGGFHLQMNVQLRPDFLSEDFSRELVRVLLAERILRNHQELQTTRQRVLPDWVLTGVTQALEFRSRSKPSAFFSAVFQRGQIYSVDKLLSADPVQLDSLARGIYETSSCALVLALLDQPDGPLRFAKFLNSLALGNQPDRDLLKDSFPTLVASRNSLEKWWTLQMASLASPTAVESLGVEETETKLDEALTLRFDPLPETPKKNKAKTPGKSAPDKPVEEPKKTRKSFFSFSNSLLPFFGGIQITFVSKPDPDIDGEVPDAPKKNDVVKKSKSQPQPETKTAAEKSAASPAKLKVQPHRVAERPDKLPKPESVTEKSKEPAKKPGPVEENQNKRSLLNPFNWFRGKEKPADAAPSDAPKKNRASGRSQKQAEALDDSKYNEQGTKVAVGPFIDDFNLIAMRPDREKILQRNLDLLGQLKLQANPLFRPLVGDYSDVICMMIKGKERNVTAKLAELKKRRLQISQQAKAVESYTDWYEASETKGYSGTFEDYLKLCEKIDKEIRPRTDAISKYLDALAKEYQ